jgi:hypothetical protein
MIKCHVKPRVFMNVQFPYIHIDMSRINPANPKPPDNTKKTGLPCTKIVPNQDEIISAFYLSFIKH